MTSINSSANPSPGDVAFLALIEHQFGHPDRATALLDRLREIMKQPQWAKDPESQALLHEAEWLNAIASDQTISEPVRQRSLQFARECKP